MVRSLLLELLVSGDSYSLAFLICENEWVESLLSTSHKKFKVWHGDTFESERRNDSRMYCDQIII